MKKWLAIALLLAAVLARARAGEWLNVTNNIGGDTWGYAGVTYVACVPNSTEVIAGVSERGVWSSTDGGATWKKLGAGDKEQIKHRTHKIVFDPKDPATFWVSGCYGSAVFKTTDGGKTFQKLNAPNHADGVAIDFSDPERKTLLLGLHEQARSLHISKDGGTSFQKIGDKLPEDSNHSTDPIIIDSKTFLINTAGWKQKSTLGIYRSEDAGETWTKISDFGPSGNPLVASDGTMYWQRVWGGGLLQSTDSGKSWTQIPAPVKSNVIELPGKRLAGFVEKQIHVSTDAGKTWTKLDPPLPFKASGIAYSAPAKCFYCWHLTDKKDTQAIVRLNVD
ncbi:MAG TPA: hypothetical protein VKX17_09725 [Planctomycetota bacterium]|nr:hypothetical protein [Planctomycetota bacterium]